MIIDYLQLMEHILISIKNNAIDTAFTNDRITIRINRFRDPTQKFISHT